MGMTTRHTSASNLQKALNENLVTIKSVTVESKDDYGSKTIPAEQFKSDLDFYMESGVFADSLDFKYTLFDTELTVYIGNLSSYYDKCITVELIANDDVSKEELEKIIKKVDIEELKESIRKIDRALIEYIDDKSPEKERRLHELRDILKKEEAKMEK